ncbi:peroxisomal testis-specific protein 1 [Rattus rattus]|nr:peroxisomal testis-specific protein 1 [Rattus rattus]
MPLLTLRCPNSTTYGSGHRKSRFTEITVGQLPFGVLVAGVMAAVMMPPSIVYKPKEVLNPTFKVTNCYRSKGHNPLRQTKENPGQNHQPEEIQTLTMQLRHIGDSVNHRMIQEHFPQEVGNVLVPLVALMFMRGQVLLRFFWNNHLL